jgi:hypothetical protein
MEENIKMGDVRQEEGCTGDLEGAIDAVVNLQSQLIESPDLSYQVIGNLHAGLSLLNDEENCSNHLYLPENIMGEISTNRVTCLNRYTCLLEW